MHPKWAGKEAELNRQLRQAALEGHGVLPVDDLFALGITRRMIETRKKTGKLIPVLKHVNALPGARLRMNGRCRAAVCSAGPNVHLSHGSALALHGLIREPGQVHLIGEAGAFRIGKSRKWNSKEFGFKVECHQTRFLPQEHLAVVHGIRTTTVERAIRDFAALASRSEIAKALTQGEKEKSICWETLRAIVSASTGQRGLRALRSEIEQWDPVLVDAASEPEIDFLLMIRRHDMPVPAVNVKLGPYVPDFLWKHLQLAVELDPYGTHSGRASHRRDHRKGIELEAVGLRVIRFTGEDLYLHEERTAKELWAILGHQAALLQRPVFPPHEGETRETP